MGELLKTLKEQNSSDLTLLNRLEDEEEILLAQFCPWEIRFKDIDPDTGEISQDSLICVCKDERSAYFIMEAIISYMKEFDEPNREFYKKLTV